VHNEPFFQDGGDDDEYNEWSRGLHTLTGG
jgi:hypothetical protein